MNTIVQAPTWRHHNQRYPGGCQAYRQAIQCYNLPFSDYRRTIPSHANSRMTSPTPTLSLELCCCSPDISYRCCLDEFGSYHQHDSKVFRRGNVGWCEYSHGMGTFHTCHACDVFSSRRVPRESVQGASSFVVLEEQGSHSAAILPIW